MLLLLTTVFTEQTRLQSCSLQVSLSPILFELGLGLPAVVGFFKQKAGLKVFEQYLLNNSILDMKIMASSTRKCKNKANSFCYICGIYALPRQRRNISFFVKRAHTKHIFKFLLVIKRRIGVPVLYVIIAKKCFEIKRRESERVNHSVFLWCGESQKTILMTVTFVWLI